MKKEKVGNNIKVFTHKLIGVEYFWNLYLNARDKAVSE